MTTTTIYELRNLKDPRELALHGYRFMSLAHTRQWLAQPFVTDTAYAVAITTVRPSKRKCRQCGYQSEVVVRTRTLSVSAFLAETAMAPAQRRPVDEDAS